MKALRSAIASLFAIEPSRIRHVDGLRGLSILLVMAGHLFLLFSVRGLMGTSGPFSALGALRGDLGVDVFFAISGFLIGSMVFSHLERGAFSLWTFYRRRFLRLAPAYYVTLVVLLLLDRTSLSGGDRETWVYNVLYLSNMTPLFRQFMPWSWSLSIEEQFYWVFPLLAMVVVRVRATATPWILLAWLALSCVWMLVLLRHYGIPPRGASLTEFVHFADYVYASTLFRSGCITCGLLVAWMNRRPAALDAMKRWSGPHGALLALPLVVAGGIVCSFPERTVAAGNVAYAGLSHVVAAACSALVMLRLQVGRVPMVSRVLEASWLVPVAKLSYSLYLVHPIIYGALGDAFVARGLPATAGNVGTLMVASVVAAFACATLLYVFVEKPIMDRR